MRIGIVASVLAAGLVCEGAALAQDEDGSRITKVERDVLEIRGQVARAFETHRGLAQSLQAWREALAAKHGVKYEFPNLAGTPRAVPRSLFGQGDTRAVKMAALSRELGQLRAEFRQLRDNDMQMRRALGAWQGSIHRWRGGERFLTLDGSAPGEMNLADGDGSYDWIASQTAQMRGFLSQLRGSVVRLAAQMRVWKGALEEWQAGQWLPSNFDVESAWPGGFLSPNRGASQASH